MDTLSDFPRQLYSTDLKKDLTNKQSLDRTKSYFQEKFEPLKHAYSKVTSFVRRYPISTTVMGAAITYGAALSYHSHSLDLFGYVIFGSIPLYAVCGGIDLFRRIKK